MKRYAYLLYSLALLSLPAALYAGSFLVEFEDFPLYDLHGDGTQPSETLTTSVQISIDPTASSTYALTLHRPNMLPFEYDETMYTGFESCPSFPCTIGPAHAQRTKNYSITNAYDPLSQEWARFSTNFKLSTFPINSGEIYQHSISMNRDIFADLLNLERGDSLFSQVNLSNYYARYYQDRWDDFGLSGTGNARITALDARIATPQTVAPVPLPAPLATLLAAFLSLFALKRARGRRNPAF